MRTLIPAVPVVLALGILTTACSSPRPEAPTVMLPRGGDTVATDLDEVTEAAWLGAGRYAVVSPTDRRVLLVDFHARSTTPLDSARLMNPNGVFAVGDTLWVRDWGRRRLTAWHGGRLVDSIPAPDATRGALPQARDGAGRFYAELYPIIRPDGAGSRDSALVLRGDRTFARADTVVRLSPLDVTKVQSREGERFERRVFSGQDRWGVARDGALWVARVYQNRVDRIAADGTVRRGEALRDRVLEVTRTDRELFKRSFPPELRSHAENLPFSAVKPPFETAFSGGDGRVWLEKSRAPIDTTQRYHAVGADGALDAEVHLPGRGRVLAISDDGRALAVERRDGRVLLVRLRLPAFAADTAAAP